jgi:hypothetical protein
MFQELKRKLRWLRPSYVITFAAGTILSAGVGILLTDALQRNLALLVIAVSILVLSTMIFADRIAESVESHLIKHHPSVSFSTYGEEQVEEGLKRMSDTVRRAKNSIVILSAAVSSHQNSIQLRMPAGREKYLRTIESTIKNKLDHERTNNFKYRRILQSNNISEASPNTLRSDQTDLQTFEHCRRVFETLSTSPRRNRVDFDLAIRRPVLSCPSILVVDEEYVNLVIPGENREFNEAGVRTKVALIEQASVSIEDRSGEIAQHYVQLIEQLAQEAMQIDEIVGAS